MSNDGCSGELTIPVQLDEKLIQRLSHVALVLAAALAAHGVNLINKHNTRRLLARICKQLAHPLRPNADVELVKLATAHVEERHAGLAGNRACQMRLSGAWGSVQLRLR